MQKAKLFMNGRSQAVRLPREFRFEGDQVTIRKVGNAVVLTPDEPSWDDFFNAASKFTDDFFADGRQQGEQQEREDLF